MIEADKRRFTHIMKTTFKMYDKTLDVDVINMWWSIMAKVDIESFAKGMRDHLVCPDSGKYVPKVADIIAKIGGDRNDRKDAGEFAWQRVMGAMAEHGSYASVAFDDPAIHYAIEIAFGTWPRIGKLSVDDPFPRKDFCTAYAAYNGQLGHVKYFVGLAEVSNNAESFQDFVPKISFIGDKKSAKAVMLSGRSSAPNLLQAETSGLSLTHVKDIEKAAANHA